MSGFPKVDGEAAARAERTMQAREQVRGWTNALKERQLSACMFSLTLPLVDGSAFFIGQLDHELREAGYIIASHSSVVAGQHPTGQPIMLHTFLVRAKGDVPKVLLA